MIGALLATIDVPDCVWKEGEKEQCSRLAASQPSVTVIHPWRRVGEAVGAGTCSASKREGWHGGRGTQGEKEECSRLTCVLPSVTVTYSGMNIGHGRLRRR